jgi:multicomponent Na+:H+ antiporter subunit B
MKTIQQRVRDGGGGTDLIIRTAVSMMVPFIQIFGIYVIVHGHYSPGGGFQGGVLLGASFILLALAYDVKYSMKYFSQGLNALLVNVGVLIFAGFGLLCALLGGFLLDYGAWSQILPMSIPEWRYWGIFVIEVGVGLGVMGIMISLYWDLASDGTREEGL